MAARRSAAIAVTRMAFSFIKKGHMLSRETGRSRIRFLSNISSAFSMTADQLLRLAHERSGEDQGNHSHENHEQQEDAAEESKV